MAYYKDIREYIDALEANGQLIRIKREINKDTELMALVRWEFRGLPDKDRKAFLFENVTDVKGKKYNTPVLVGSHAGSRAIYGLAMQCKPEEIMAKWDRAQLHPIKPRLVECGPVQEEVHLGRTLLEHEGLGEFAIPLSTPGFDNAPYFTAGCVVSKDPETGIRNVGDYRSMVKAPDRMGFHAMELKHLRQHWTKWKKAGHANMPVAVAVSATPNIGLVSVTHIPYGVDEYDIAGGISGEPVELVKCKTVDLEVPATAELVIEGLVPTDCLEPEGPFAEHPGYIGMGEKAALFLNVTGITHRKNPIWVNYLSQFPPSESSILRGVGAEAYFYKVLHHDVGLDGVLEVVFHNDSGSAQMVVIRVNRKKMTQAQVWQALYAATGAEATLGKIIIAVDEDIDPRDMDSVTWAMCYGMQPHRDVRILEGKTASLDLSAVPPDQSRKGFARPATSAMLIDATRKWGYPPIALPEKSLMERARQIWEEEGLPPLSPKAPWHGIDLGYWPEENVEEAALALRGEHYKTGEKFAQRRVKV